MALKNLKTCCRKLSNPFKAKTRTDKVTGLTDTVPTQVLVY